MLKQQYIPGFVKAAAGGKTRSTCDQGRGVVGTCGDSLVKAWRVASSAS
jgi:hypothetical protein